MRESLLKSLLCIGAYAFVVGDCLANGPELGGHLKYQYASSRYDSDDLFGAIGTRQLDDHEIDLRLNYSNTWKQIEFNLSAEVLGLAGERVEKASSLPGAQILPQFAGGVLPNDKRRLFDLTHQLIERDDYVASSRLDRLSVAYLSENFVLRLGRQAISWGGGLAFHVLDLFNPFSPAAIDKDYKTGDDLLYLQWLAGNGGDLQLLVIPRREVDTGSVLSSESSYAGKWRGRVGSLDYDLMAAWHFDELVFGTSIALTLLDAIWRIDVSRVDRDQGSIAWSVVANVDRSFYLAGKNVYAFVEYFHNDFGVEEAKYQLLPEALSQRLDRGELYTLGKDYLSVGLQVEISPRLSSRLSQFYNLRDESGFIQAQTEVDLLQDLSLLLGLNAPFGARGTEFGGVQYVQPGLYLGQTWTLFSRLSYYF